MKKVILGYNCEIALQYERLNKKIESSLFNYAYIGSYDKALSLIENRSCLFSKGGVFKENFMYEDTEYKISFHTKYPKEFFLNRDGTIDQSKVDTGLIEVKERCMHLKNKLLELIESDDEMIFFAKFQKEKNDTNYSSITKMVDIILKNKKNRKLICLLERENQSLIGLLDRIESVEIRLLDFFAPDINVHEADESSWNEIIQEFP